LLSLPSSTTITRTLKYRLKIFCHCKVHFILSDTIFMILWELPHNSRQGKDNNRRLLAFNDITVPCLQLKQMIHDCQRSSHFILSDTIFMILWELPHYEIKIKREVMSKMWKQWIHSSTTVRNSQWPDRPRLSKIDSGFPSSNYHGPIVRELIYTRSKSIIN
jgi:hypothetical protein